MIITRTPFRVSLFGGGTDYPEWFCRNGGKVISLAINRYCYVTTRYLPPYFKYNYRIRFFEEQQVKFIKNIKNPVVRETLKYLKFQQEKIELVHHADLPGMSGLGGSSAFAVGILNALNNLKYKQLNKRKFAYDAFHIERNLVGEKVGFQDQVICSLGGLRLIEFKKNKKFYSNILNINKIINQQIEQNFFLVYTGLQRYSKIITKNLSTKINKSNNDIHLRKMDKITQEALKLFQYKKLDLKILGELMTLQWNEKKKLARGISNNYIEKMYNTGILSGAYGGKLLGAGGGGFLLFIVPNSKINKFKKNFSKFMYLKIKIDNYGTKLLYNSES